MDYDAYIDAFNSGDEAGFVTTYFAPDAIIESSGEEMTRDGFLQHIIAMHDGARETIRPVVSLQDGDQIMAELDLTFVGEADRPNFPLGPLTPGQERSIKVFASYTLRDGVITRLKLAAWPPT